MQFTSGVCQTMLCGGKNMKRIAVLLLAILMMSTTGMNVYAQTAETEDLEAPKVIPGDSDVIMPMCDCSHQSLVRITKNSVRYVSVSGSFHTKEEYFTARCSECMQYQNEIINSQVVEPHTMVLVISNCDFETKKHLYVYRCLYKCNYRDEITLNCLGIHEVEGAESLASMRLND